VRSKEQKKIKTTIYLCNMVSFSQGVIVSPHDHILVPMHCPYIKTVGFSAEKKKEKQLRKKEKTINLGWLLLASREIKSQQQKRKTTIYLCKCS